MDKLKIKLLKLIFIVKIWPKKALFKKYGVKKIRMMNYIQNVLMKKNMLF